MSRRISKAHRFLRDGHKGSAKAMGMTWYRHELWSRLKGRKVVFARTVERDSFTVPRGRVGFVEEPIMDDGVLVLAVRLQTPPEGSKDYDGEVHWREGVNLLEVEDDIRLVPLKTR